MICLARFTKYINPLVVGKKPILVSRLRGNDGPENFPLRLKV